MALGQLEDEVPRMPDQPPARLEQPLLETREGTALDGDGQDEPTEQIAEVVGDDPEQEADLVGPAPMPREPGVQWMTLLPSLIHCSAVPR